MEVEMTTGDITRAKLQSNRHQQQTNTKILQAGCPSCHPTNSVKHWRKSQCYTEYVYSTTAQHMASCG